LTLLQANLKKICLTEEPGFNT